MYTKKYPLYFNIPYGNETVSSGYSSKPKIEHVYTDTDGVYVYHLGPKVSTLEPRLFTTPQLQMSHFEGCPHYYGFLHMPNGDKYELQCVITASYMSEAHEMKGDWNGYKLGDKTNRFLNKESLHRAFELFKNIIVNDD